MIIPPVPIYVGDYLQFLISALSVNFRLVLLSREFGAN
ncbi:MAG: hypothetical protein RLZZ490_2280 [Cyanobacteriota bacterium]|jgi:hypothetical protein